MTRCTCHQPGLQLGPGADDPTRRDFLDLLAAGGLAALAGLSPGPARAAPRDGVVRIGYIPITDATALLVAYANGYFKDEGLDAAPPTLIRSWPALTESFAAGRLNLVHLLNPIPVWMRYNNKVPVKIAAWGHVNGSAVVVGRDTGIRSFAELGGRQVAVPFWYSMHNILLQMALRHAGIEPGIRDQTAALGPKQCNLQVMAPSDMPPALASRKIDAYIVAEPFDAAGEVLAGGHVLRFTGDIWKNHPCCVITMHERDTVERPEWSQKVMNAIVRAEVFAAENKKEVARLLSRDGKGFLPMGADIVGRAMTLYDPKTYADPPAILHEAEWKNGRIDFMPWPYPSATTLMIRAMNETLVSGDKTFLGDLDPAKAATDLVDARFVRAAMEKHWPWRLSPGTDPAHPFEREEVLAL